MVGVRTVNRCDTCRIRKRKCLGQLPECSECVRSGWKCPGYKTAWKFVDETTRMRKYYSTRKYVYDTDSDDLASQFGDDSSAHQARSKWKNVSFRSHPSKKINKMKTQIGETNIPRFNGIDPIASRLVYLIRANMNGPYMPLTMSSSSFSFIPARLGRNAALDESIRCLCLVYTNPDLTLREVSRSVYRSYSSAIASLRTYIYDPATSMDAETLAAAIVMQMCELAISRDDGKWNHLARGTALLIEARGVKRYGSAFEMAMLESQFGLLCRQSTKFLEPSFLLRAEWRALLKNAPEYDFHKSQPKSLTLRARLCGNILIGVSSLILGCVDLGRMASTNQVGWEQHADSLIDKTYSLYDNMRTWQSAETSSLYLPSSDAEEGARENLCYVDMVAGVVDCLSLMHTVMVHKLLHHLCFEQLGPTGKPRPKQLDIRQRLDSPEIRRQRLARAVVAYEYVNSQSPLAAKPMEFGLHYVRTETKTPPGTGLPAVIV